MVTTSDKDLVSVRYFDSRRLPAVIEPAIDGVDLVSWGATQREFVDSMLAESGAILFRNFGVGSVEGFRGLVEAVCGPLLEYKERSSPRTHVTGNVYTSTDYPPERTIFLHNEQSYNHIFPLRIAFFCVTPPAKDGETPIADVRRVLLRVPEEIRRRLESQGYLYVRNFGSGVGLSWQESFQTDDPGQVEEHCRSNFVEFEWLPQDGLRTRQLRPVIARHPSGVHAWFNHLTFFHISTLEQDIQQEMLANFSQADLPNNTYYGDGTLIEPEVLEKLREAYIAERVSFPWESGDILLLDNVLTAHARAPFTPPRRIVTAMARPCSWSDVRVSNA
ncbi:MAG TPA: TauD/TfdA family dioxygenase [Candidatus Angelobacter sp.]|jgi:alpha-ketoglutarate-dependent taurine dioxygenase